MFYFSQQRRTKALLPRNTKTFSRVAKAMHESVKLSRHFWVMLVCGIIGLTNAHNSTVRAAIVFGPVNAIAGGEGPGLIEWFEGTPPTAPEQAWTVSAWVKVDAAPTQPELIAGFGDGIDFNGSQRYFAADAQGWYFWIGEKGRRVPPSNAPRMSHAPIMPHHWQMLTATYDGSNLCFYVDAKLVFKDAGKLNEAAMQPLIAPPPPWKEGGSFAGSVARFSIQDTALSIDAIAQQAAESSDGLDKLNFESTPRGPTPSNRWAEFKGTRNQPRQDPATYPKPVPQVKTVRIPKMRDVTLPTVGKDGDLILASGWELADASTVSATPAQMSQVGFNRSAWYDATVPGTVLTTLVQQGVYPDPTHGLNNMLIPELAKKTWWYRAVCHATRLGRTTRQSHVRGNQLSRAGLAEWERSWRNIRRIYTRHVRRDTGAVEKFDECPAGSNLASTPLLGR